MDRIRVQGTQTSLHVDFQGQTRQQDGVSDDDDELGMRMRMNFDEDEDDDDDVDDDSCYVF